mmetsp:Transcript_7519/g.7059  ORF Transcript_7519/g.7059 Transcript_7519/m.7059 type:complete len:84 (-) Transcript_7519:194-445(-)
MLQHFMTISIKGREELRNSNLNSKEENRSRSFLKKSHMSTLVSKPRVVAGNSTKRQVKGRQQNHEKTKIRTRRTDKNNDLLCV